MTKLKINEIHNGRHMEKDCISILCSGVALGVYIPGISLNYQLRNRGFDTEVVVLENLLVDDLKAKIDDTKKAFHMNFKLAQIGQRMVRKPVLDRDKVNKMFSRWKLEGRNHFILFSGFWLEVLDQYRQFVGSGIVKTDLVHMDSVPSPSWQDFEESGKGACIYYLFEYEKKKLNYLLNVATQKPLPYEKRTDRYLVHGGGWGMGTYQKKLQALEQNGLALDIMAYYEDEIHAEKVSNRYFIVDPQWSPWIANDSNEHTFPPVARIKGDERSPYQYRPEYHELYYIGANDKAIISKPGGSTLVDSFASATPLIFLDSFGPHENYNASLWVEFGFGVIYEDWEKSGYSCEILERCHDNIMNMRNTIPDFIDNYL